MGTWLDEMTEQLKGKQAVDLVAGLNRKLRGWANHFCLGPVSKAYRAVGSHTRVRIFDSLPVLAEGKGRAVGMV